ncbi:exonuclease SbcC [Acinetobacter calcoaceticus]|uniref:Exonuclease SbcC n=1 Tax=Acinetobacter calcoaceticus TaxID=471 RepID=A0A4R1XT18_ACICA|nr:exonuclease SbcC [Acinetobacter calcoaceticus]
MKILSIRLKNLASLAGEHFIDFESDPLASAGLIAIVGKTGAGKSTILDAMCLALFNKVPRLKDSDGKLLDVDGSELAANSPLTVLRRGSAHGFAELCFVAQDQKRYLARWEIKRARENPTGKLQSVQRYLKCLTDAVVIADKTKAVEEQIKLITQLSFEQFTRAVLLAQSEVTAFLKARDNERGELLEYLTNSNIFGRIGELAFRKTAEIAKQRKQLEDVLGHVEMLSEDQVTALNQQHQQASTTVNQLQLEKTLFEQQQLWYLQLQKIQLDTSAKQQHYDLQQHAHQQMATQRSQLQRLEQFSAIRPMVFQQQQQRQSHLQLQPQIQQRQTQFDQLSQQFSQESQHYHHTEQQLIQAQHFDQKFQSELKQLRHCIEKRDFIKDEYQKAKSKLSELQGTEQPLLEQQQQLQLQQQHLDQQHRQLTEQLQNSQHFAPLDQGLEVHIRQLQQFIPDYLQIERQLGDPVQAQSKLQHATQQNADFQAQWGSLQAIEKTLEQQRSQREVQLSQANQLLLIQQQLKHYQQRHLASDQLQQQQQQLNTQLIQLQTDHQSAEAHYHSSKTERVRLQQVLEQQRLLHSENIEQLRAALQPDQACLVCGSTEHPYRDHQALISKALFELQQQQLQQAETSEHTALQQWQSSQQALSKCNTSLEQYTLQLEGLNSELQQLKQQWHLQLQSCAAAPQFDPTQDLTAAQLNQLDQTIECVQQQVQQLEASILQQNQVIKTQQLCAAELQQLQQLFAAATQRVSQVEHILQYHPASPERASLSQAAIAETVLLQLQQRAEQVSQLLLWQKQLQQQQQQLSLLLANQQHLSTQIADQQRLLEGIAAEGSQNTSAAMQLITTMTGIAESKPNEWLLQHDQHLQQAQADYQQAKQHYEASRLKFEAQKNQLEQLQSQSLRYQQQISQSNQDIEDWLKQQPEFSAPDLDQLIQISSSQEQQLRAELQQTERLLGEAAAALHTMQAQLSEHQLQQPEVSIDELQIKIANNLQALELHTAQRDQFKLQLELHQQSLAKQKQFAEQILVIQQQEHRWSKISGLMGDATGKKFRDYAQQYHLDILIEYANQQLEMLSQRYTLKRLDNSLSLAIIDHDMDGETRSVSSLSGGESFLTALALSLAIANMASGSMKIESLFIDEGFGTLDASSLHMVMNALDQLQSQGRKVVLISHIQDMHERIPVQIQVNPRGAGASSIEVVG